MCLCLLLFQEYWWKFLTLAQISIHNEVLTIISNFFPSTYFSCRLRFNHMLLYAIVSLCILFPLWRVFFTSFSTIWLPLNFTKHFTPLSLNNMLQKHLVYCTEWNTFHTVLKWIIRLFACIFRETTEPCDWEVYLNYNFILLIQKLIKL